MLLSVRWDSLPQSKFASYKKQNKQFILVLLVQSQNRSPSSFKYTVFKHYLWTQSIISSLCVGQYTSNLVH